MNVLRQVGWLATSSPEFQEALLSRCDTISVAGGEAIYRVDDPSGGLFGVSSGRIELHLPGLREDHTLCHLGGPGYWFGDLAALSGLPRRFDVLAGSDCQLARLPRAELLRLLHAEPDAWRNVAMLVNGNLDLAVKVVEALKQQNPLSRVGLCLRNLTYNAPAFPYRIDATQADIAALSGLSRRITNSALRSLEKAGVIEIGYRRIDVLSEVPETRLRTH